MICWSSCVIAVVVAFVSSYVAVNVGFALTRVIVLSLYVAPKIVPPLFNVLIPTLTDNV